MRTRAPGSSHENCCFMGQFRKFMTIQPIFDATAQSARLNSMCNDVLLEYYRTLGKNRLEGNDAFQDPFRLAGLERGLAWAMFTEKLGIRIGLTGHGSGPQITWNFLSLEPS